MNMSIKLLVKTGFKEKEAKLYLALLELGEGNVLDIARKSGIKRTTVYHVLEELKNRGIVSSTKKDEKVIYIPTDPRNIREDLKEKEAIFEKALPTLLSISNILEKKPAIKYFEGLEGIKELYRDELQYSDSEILAWWSESYNIFGDDFFYDYYMPERSKKKIWVRVMVPKSKYMEQIQKDDVSNLRKIKFITEEMSNIELEISIYGKSKVSIKSFQEKFGILIESRAFFNTMKVIFELQWKSC